MIRAARDGKFRPWCPVCDATSKPHSRYCDSCGLGLYPTEKQLATLVAIMRRSKQEQAVESEQ